MAAQLPLNIQLRDDATFASFYPGNNHQVLKSVTEMAKGQGESFLYVWGQGGTGRTHLLQATCHAANDSGLGSVYIPLRDLKGSKSSFGFLQDVESVPLICIDDIHCIVGEKNWEEALFHLFNRIRLQNGRLLITGDAPIVHLNIGLADLKSRLTWGIIYQLQPLNDEQKLSALQLRAFQRGLQLDKTVGRFLLNRCPRNMIELFDTLECLDRASLTEQRRLTIPFIKHVLEM